MSTIWGVNFGRACMGGLEPWSNKAEKIAETIFAQLVLLWWTRETLKAGENVWKVHMSNPKKSFAKRPFGLAFPVGAHVWTLFRNPQTRTTCLKSTGSTPPIYRNTPPICNGVPCPLLNLSLEERGTPQYASCLYRSTPPIGTAVRLPFVPALPKESLKAIF